MRAALRLTAFAALAAIVLNLAGTKAASQAEPSKALDALHKKLDAAAEAVMPRVVSWRRDLHEHPELGNRETRTSELLAKELRSMGYEVRTGIAKTGVVGVLSGGKPGPGIALRADMDALPVTEETGLPFASKARGEYNGREVGVMHACGHDFHMSILLGAAQVLAGMKADLPGTVVIIFQPAEEGTPEGESGGAKEMVREGVLNDPKVEAIFGLHVGIQPVPTGSISFRPKGLMAASDTFTIVVKGKQTHGAMPWAGIDPIVVAAQIVESLQTIVSRQVDLTAAPAVVTVGTIEGGSRFNIVPDQVKMTGTIRTFDAETRKFIQSRVKRITDHVAAASGTTAEITISQGSPVTWNDPALTERMAPSLQRVAAGNFDPNAQVTTGAEDFAYYGEKVPAFYFFLGTTPPGSDPSGWAPNHSPKFNPDEAALITGVRAMASVAVDFLAGAGKPR